MDFCPRRHFTSPREEWHYNTLSFAHSASLKPACKILECALERRVNKELKNLTWMQQRGLNKESNLQCLNMST